LAGVVAFHGLLETKRPAIQGDIKAKVLVCTGGADPLVPAEQIDPFRREMVEAGADVQIIIYGNAKHAFTNTAAETVPLQGFGYSRRGCALMGSHENLLSGSVSCTMTHPR
jgi:dienelactone hydrolase